MTEALEHPKAPDAKDDEFVIDAPYIRGQAGEAITLFLAPFSGVYRAAVGNRSKLFKQGLPKKVA